jgi:hypothetical protein
MQLLFWKYSGEREGLRPSSAEEEAKAGDETSGSRLRRAMQETARQPMLSSVS